MVSSQNSCQSFCFSGCPMLFILQVHFLNLASRGAVFLKAVLKVLHVLRSLMPAMTIWKVLYSLPMSCDIWWFDQSCSLFICAMFSSFCKTRLLFHNTGAWPEDGKDAYFPDDSNGAIFSCASFYTSGDRVLLIPDAHIGLSDRPVPDARVTKAINHSAVRLNVLKYASLLRGDKTCLDRGSLHDCKPTCFMKYSLLFSRFASLFFFSYSHVFWTSVLLSGYPDTIEDPPQSSGELFARMDRARNEWLGGLADCRHSWVDWLSKKPCFCDSRAVTVGNFRKSENLTRAHSNVCMILDEITRKNLAIIFPFLASLPPVQCDVVFLRLEYDLSCNYLQIASGVRPNILGRTFLKTTHFWKLTIPWLNSQHWFRVTLL